MSALRPIRCISLLLKKQLTADRLNQMKNVATTVCACKQLEQVKQSQPKAVVLHKLPAVEIDEQDALDKFNKSLNVRLDAISENCDHEYLDGLGSPLPATFNLAAYANRSHTLRKLIDLGVQLYEVEQSKEACEFILKLDFERDIKKYLMFLHDIGIKADKLGHFITKYPMIFGEEIENLKTRIKYLRIKKFTRSAIINILNEHPAFLSNSIYEVDSKLGFVQNHYNFNSLQMRKITEKWPFIIDVSQQWHRVCLFMFKEEMGFDEKEMQAILVELPSLFVERRHLAVERFDLIHNEHGIPHELIVRFPQVLQCDKQKMKERHLYLEKLKRAQYDPTKPCYVPLIALTNEVDDVEFSLKYAKTNVVDYNLFLKTI